MESPAFVGEANGAATIETYTVIYGREGAELVVDPGEVHAGIGLYGCTGGRGLMGPQNYLSELACRGEKLRRAT